MLKRICNVAQPEAGAKPNESAIRMAKTVRKWCR